MLFFSYSCLLLVLAGFVIYLYIPAHRRLACLFLLSLIFYSYTGLPSTFLLYALITINYFGAFGLTGRWKRQIFLALITLNLLNLAFFKYTTFLLTLGAKLLGADLPPGPWQHILLPIGISFYTFELISYDVDVYKERLPVCRSFLKLATFTTFFPHLIAGPIMRGYELFPQLESLPSPEPAQFNMGIYRFILGVFKKLIWVDVSLGPRVDAYFNAPLGSLSSAECLVAMLLFGFQIYLDFSAYCDMAVGLGLIFGVKLQENFRTPYFSLSPMEFWQRWNITLSRWIKDYIYIPLGGSRVSSPRAAANLIVTMFLAGLWHGASLNFGIWGLYHGGLLVMYHYLEKYITWLRRGLDWSWRSWPAIVIAWLIFFFLAQLGWLFFRAQSLDQSISMLTQIFSISGWAEVTAKPKGVNLIFTCLAFHGVEALLQNPKVPVSDYWKRVPVVVRGFIYASFLVFIWIKASGEARSFIYFQF
jgi:alginate O-acetyltransferase complex protein AlgI